MKSKQIIIMLLSFIILFAISCKNDDKTGGGSGGVDLGSIPTASGTAADASELTTYNGKTYTGTIGSGVYRKSYSPNPQEFGEQFSLEASGGQAFVTITDNKINYSGASSGAQVQIYKSADGNSYIASEDIDLDGFKYKSYIQITFKSATEITFYLYTGMTGGPLMTESGAVYDTGGYIAEYEGTLTAQ
ncbi:hypothetical protein [Brachyspira aalborgi]|uniref:hypothetical protein n=1 Tax=Brachyspira aalborgi TaxID=29522 RepID=UPI00266563C1|nr:hypothetical protein [Brachyspira aalborgi]